MSRRHKNALVAITLLAFTAFSLWVVVRHGYFGFWRLARHDEWAMQMLVDLVIALVLFSAWMRRDARARGIDIWPYLLALPLFGSLAALVYMLHRETKR
jgi:hypothetical protein